MSPWGLYRLRTTLYLSTPLVLVVVCDRVIRERFWKGVLDIEQKLGYRYCSQRSYRRLTDGGRRVGGEGSGVCRMVVRRRGSSRKASPEEDERWSCSCANERADSSGLSWKQPCVWQHPEENPPRVFVYLKGVTRKGHECH